MERLSKRRVGWLAFVLASLLLGCTAASADEPGVKRIKVNMGEFHDLPDEIGRVFTYCAGPDRVYVADHDQQGYGIAVSPGGCD